MPSNTGNLCIDFMQKTCLDHNIIFETMKLVLFTGNTRLYVNNMFN